MCTFVLIAPAYIIHMQGMMIDLIILFLFFLQYSLMRRWG